MSRGFAKFLENNFSKVNDSGALSDYAARGRGGKAPARVGARALYHFCEATPKRIGRAFSQTSILPTPRK